MAFQFQVNANVKFRRVENFLRKAEENRPEIKRKEVKAARIVELVEDETKLEGYWVKESEKELPRLSEYGFGREESFILDFGDHYTGSFRIQIDAAGSPMDAPLFLRLKFAEVPAELAADSGAYEGWLSSSWIQEEFIHIDELPAKLELPRRYSFRYAELKVLDTSPKWKAVFSDPSMIAETSADESRLRPVKIEDALLQKIYDVGVKTLAECMQDVFEDGPKRDRRLWLGDLHLQALANYASFDNKELVKRCLYLFAAMPTEEGKIPADVFVKPKYVPDDTFLFEYSLFFISTLYDYENVHPEKILLEDLYPTAKAQMDLSLSMVDGQGRLRTDDSYPVFADWSNEFQKDTAGQAMMIYVLKQFLVLAREMGDADLSHYQDMLDRMEAFSRNQLYDSDKKLFFAGKNREYHIASQAWMVLAHVMDDEENAEIMKTVVSEMFPVTGIATPYMYHYIVEALFEAGLEEDAVKLMKEYWGMMIRLGADTYWEAFEPERPGASPYGSPLANSYCHAWSCTPVYLIRKYLSGQGDRFF